MRRIAIIGENSNLVHVVKKELSKLNIKYELVNLTSTDLAVDYVVINQDINYELKNIKGSYYFINMDSKFKNNLSVCGNVITYGLGSKNTITLSSVEKDEGYLVYCLQRYIKNIDENIVEPCEIPIKRNFNNNNELYGYMIAMTIAIVENVDIITLNSIFNKEEMLNKQEIFN